MHASAASCVLGLHAGRAAARLEEEQPVPLSLETKPYFHKAMQSVAEKPSGSITLSFGDSKVAIPRYNY